MRSTPLGTTLRTLRSAAILALLAGSVALPLAGQAGPGRIGGRVFDAQSGRPLPAVQVSLEGTGVGVLTDPTGQFRTQAVAPGTYTVVTQLIGYAQGRQAEVVVRSGETTLVEFALTFQAVQVQGISVEVQGAGSGRTSTEAALLARQRNAAVVSDGISAEQISRSPDSNAGDAIARVTGVSVVDDKFVVIRGLAERYSTTQLNGAELPSPEPTKRVVPLDVFPASLLESVVTVKASTPDRPGDFAAGSVDITTKEFPEESVLDLKFSTGFDERSTFRKLPMPRRSGLDLIAFDGQDRRTPGSPADGTVFAQNLRNKWAFADRTVLPTMGLGATIGGQVGEFDRAIGYVFSVDYGQSASYDPSRYFAFVTNGETGSTDVRGLSSQSRLGTDWGMVGNLSARLGSNHTISLKNLVTRESEETFIERLGVNPENQTSYTSDIRTTQVRYIERQVIQSQLGGRHYFDGILGSTLEWKVTGALAQRDEPENRSVNYLYEIAREWWTIDDSKENSFWFRFLDETTYSGQLDWSLPLSIHRPDNFLLKFGGMARIRRRDLDASRYNLNVSTTGVAPDGPDVLTLPPEQLFSPENIGRNVRWGTVAVGGLPYDAKDDVYAGYGMIDYTPANWLRLTGGLRTEVWNLNVTTPLLLDEVRETVDLLWSFNTKISPTSSSNFRLATFQTVSRPDPREVSQTLFEEVSGECTVLGNPQLGRARILNADARWEWFPSPGELLSVSTFFKSFDDPFVQAVSISSLACVIQPLNAESATNFGVEAEVRKSLGFLSQDLDPLSVSVNFTWVDGSVTPKPENSLGEELLPLQDQSNILLNGSLAWDDSDAGLSAAFLVNYFGDRLSRYGARANVGGAFIRTPDVYERGRTTLDAKVSQRLGDVSVSLSVQNITGVSFESYQATQLVGAVPTGLETGGVRGSLGLTWSVR